MGGKRQAPADLPLIKSPSSRFRGQVLSRHSPSFTSRITGMVILSLTLNTLFVAWLQLNMCQLCVLLLS